MTSEKKERKQFNWRFKGDEAPELMEWFDNQRNITSSLESILNHIIEIYGTEDIMTHKTQKQLFKDSMLLESLKGQEVVSIKQEVVSHPKLEQINKVNSEEDKAFEPLDEADQGKDNHVEEDEVSKKNAISEAEEVSEEEPVKRQKKNKKRSYMKDVNSKLL
ncbi:hypothetical protein [Priestia megaterium]|uniref:hypothetical protein n=1 Tax=Priestia megaterium TaxID=1404 RepID=UPI0012B981A9|nr:hypothetical protein [Priestia megaterium]